MTNKLVKLLNEAADLLEVCGAEDVELWFRSKMVMLKKSPLTSSEFQAVLKEISHNLVRMGSFSDVVMKTKNKSGITREEAERKQENLIAEIGLEIDSLLKPKNVSRDKK